MPKVLMAETCEGQVNSTGKAQRYVTPKASTLTKRQEAHVNSLLDVVLDMVHPSSKILRYCRTHAPVGRHGETMDFPYAGSGHAIQESLGYILDKKEDISQADCVTMHITDIMVGP